MTGDDCGRRVGVYHNKAEGLVELRQIPCDAPDCPTCATAEPESVVLELGAVPLEVLLERLGVTGPP